MSHTIAVFDLDGTILDTLDDLQASVNAALARYGLPARTLSEVRAFVGNGIRKLIERAVPAGTDKIRIDAVFDAFKAHYALHCVDQTKPYDGIQELLRDLRARGFAVAVVSNKADFAVKTLCERYFPGLIDLAVGEREGVRRKPAPDSVEAVLRELGFTKGSAIYIGDSEVDIQTARNAGIACASVDWGFRDRACLQGNGAAAILSSPAALGEYLCHRQEAEGAR